MDFDGVGQKVPSQQHVSSLCELPVKSGSTKVWNAHQYCIFLIVRVVAWSRADYVKTVFQVHLLGSLVACSYLKGDGPRLKLRCQSDNRKKQTLTNALSPERLPDRDGDDVSLIKHYPEAGEADNQLLRHSRA